jgi:hypothetical protein
MHGFNAVSIGTAILLSTLALSGTRSMADPRVADLVQAGKIRLALARSLINSKERGLAISEEFRCDV